MRSSCWCGCPRDVDHIHTCGLGAWLYDLARKALGR
jgi:hypothetical protein